MPEDAADISVGSSPFEKDAFLRIDDKGQILECDRFASEMIGSSGEDIVGYRIWDILSASVKDKLCKSIIRAKSNQIHDGFEVFDARSGAWLEYHVRPTRDGFVVLILNITARQRAGLSYRRTELDRQLQLEAQIREDFEERDRLAEAQDKLKMALASAHMATWEYDLIQETLSCSENMEELIGAAGEQMPRAKEEFAGWFLGDDYAAHLDAIEKAATEGQEYISEFRLRNPHTGEVKWLENRGRIQKDDMRRPVRMYGILQDISHRKWVQRELERLVEQRTAELKESNRILRESEERVRIALLNAPISMSMLDRELRLKWIHHPLLKNPEAYFGRNLDSLLTPEGAAEVNAVAKRVLDSGEGARHETWITFLSTRTYCQIIMEPLRNEAAEIEGVTILALDMTERRRTEEHLRVLNTALEKRAEELRKLAIELTKTEERERRRLAGFLHDHLQQLFVGAKFTIHVLTTHPLDAAVRDGLDKVNKLLEEAIEGTRSLTAELAPTVLYQRGLLEALQWLAAWVQEKHGLRLALQLDNIERDLAQEIRIVLFQTVKELLFNVAKHAHVSEARVTLGYPDDKTIAVEVQDEGIGFDPETQAFNKSGGLGLFAVKERISALGGHMVITSSTGRGTSVMVCVPTHLDSVT